MSDLHFEHNRILNEYTTWPPSGWPVRAQYLILAGDIGALSRQFDDYRQFLANRCSEYKMVFLVLGNRDFPNINGHKNAKVIDLARDLERDTIMKGKLKFLEGDRYDLEANGTKITILGCTLWTQIRSDQSRGNDFNNLEGIPENTRLKHNQRFQDSLRWLREEVAKIRTSEAGGAERKIMVITHHAPFIRDASTRSNDVGQPLNNQYSYYNNDILGGSGFEGLGVGDMWVYGHTHYTNNLVIDDVRVYSNQRGSRSPDLHKYPGFHDFSIQRTIDF